jgi:ADP-ribosylglycohydrolase
MNRETLVDRFSGSLLGLAIGEALGLPVDGLTPFEVICKYEQVDGFFPLPSKGIVAGQIGRETRAAAGCCKAILFQKEEGVLSEKAVVAFLEKTEARDPFNEHEPARGLFSKMAPVGLFASASGTPDQQMATACKRLAEKAEKRHVLAAFLYAVAVREIALNRDSIQNPYELYDSDKSLLVRLREISAKAESKMEDCETRLCDMLDFVRRRLMKKSDLMSFRNMLGGAAKPSESLCRCLFAFLRSPDEFQSVTAVAGCGGNASMDAALVGGLVGAYCGASFLPKDMRDQVENSVKIEAIATALAEACLPKSEPGGD